MDQGSTSASIGGPGSEFLPEFRAIHNKLKKRFLRKPNVSEAGEQFAKLAKKMHSREEPQYEGLCHLAVARCERSLGNPSSESEALLLAARSFLKAEKTLFLKISEEFVNNFSLEIKAKFFNNKPSSR